MTAGAIGILGGTFDPVHIGHLRLAIEAKERLQLDHVRMIPCCLPPHRGPTQANNDQRLAMLSEAAQQLNDIVLDERELRRQGHSYTIDTLNSLRQDFPDPPLCLLLGMDAFACLFTWKDWRDMIRLCHIVVASRPGFQTQFDPQLQAFVHDHQTQHSAELHARNHGRIYFLQIDELMISASRIRQLQCAGRQIRYLVPESVRRYITRYNLYR